jgi:hypothetical protein
MKLHPFYACADAASRFIEKGGTVYQQFLCAKCGSKQTIGEPNNFYTKGRCEECSHVTDIQRNGCNYMVTFGLGPIGITLEQPKKGTKK